jgi:hypothetical protein
LTRRARKKSGSGFALKGLLLLFSFLLLPLTGSLVINFGSIFSRYRSFTREMLLSSCGFGFFMLLFALFGPPVRGYVLQHELSHVLFAAVSGVRVKRMSIGTAQGSVATEKVNILIALAPYAFPLYSVLLILFNVLIAPFAGEATRSLVFHPLFGFSLAYHLLATLHYLQMDQPDLKRYGVLASLIIIFTLTIVVLAMLLGAVFARTELLAYLGSSAVQAARIYERLFHILWGDM